MQTNKINLLKSVIFLQVRFQYERSSDFLLQRMNPLVQQFSEAAQQGPGALPLPAQVIVLQAHVSTAITPTQQRCGSHELVYPPCQQGVAVCAGQDGSRLESLEGQLTWLVHIVGAVLRGRLNSNSAESQVGLASCLCLIPYAHPLAASLVRVSIVCKLFRFAAETADCCITST